jgi:hypothetical protein
MTQGTPQTFVVDDSAMVLDRPVGLHQFISPDLVRQAVQERWEGDLTFDEQKTHQGPPRPGKPAQLRSATPAGVVQAVDALAPGHSGTRALMAPAAAREGIDPDRLSFAGCRRILKCRLPEGDSRNPPTWQAGYAALRWEMSAERVAVRQTPAGPRRRNRSNPRVVKRKMSNSKKKRPEHRNRPPLAKPFAETIVMRR